MTTKVRKYEVSGVDDRGDVHSFLTDDPERADEMQRLADEDLREVERTEHFPTRARRSSEK